MNLNRIYLEKKKNELNSRRLNKKGRISGYVKHIRWKTPEIWGVL